MSGRVRVDGEVAPGALVEVVDSAGTSIAQTIADGNGEYRFDSLTPGNYRVRATFADATSDSRVDVLAHSDLVIDLVVSLPRSSGEVINVVGDATSAQQHSAEAVHIVDATRSHQQSADLGEVLARTQGVAVRRSAGLGSTTRFSLDGLYDDQIRFFLDGVPLDIAGYPFGVADVPVNLVDHVEIYRGVVPIRFGADALGGAVNLVSTNARGSHASASYQIGSFGTQRATGSVRYQDDGSGLFVATSAFLDVAKNDYDVDVSVPDARGRLHDATVPRFHDGYGAAGAAVSIGAVDQSWADRLELRGFYTGYDKDLQSNPVMTVPYGEVTYGERVGGASAHYQVELPGDFRVDAIAAYSQRTIRFQDVSEWVYDWYGDQILMRRSPGEIAGSAYNNRYWQHDGFVRFLLARRLGLGEVRLSVSPTYSRRTGRDLTLADPAARDPLSADQARLTVVSGLEWELDALGDRVENIVFAKSYVFHTTYDDVLPGDIYRALSRTNDIFGGGDAVRWHPNPWLYLKASYEYATRLPSTDELFGNGVLISPDLELVPEVSHNANVGPRIELRNTAVGDVTLDVNGFWRESRNLIVLLGTDQFLEYQNVYTARSLGVEAGIEWSPIGNYVTFDTTITYDDLRNASSSGTFGTFDGDRIPNRPWLFASFGVRGHLDAHWLFRDGVLEPFYVGRYVHAFFRGWESLGLPQYKQSIPAQLSHDVGITYSGTAGGVRLAMTLEVDNLVDAYLYDSFGAQRPGRAYYLKLTGEL